MGLEKQEVRLITSLRYLPTDKEHLLKGFELRYGMI